MKNIKLVIFTLVLTLIVGALFAQNATVTFRATTNATYLRLNEEYPGGAYPRGTVAGRWICQVYEVTGDAIGEYGIDLPLTNDNNNQFATIQATPPTVFTFTLAAGISFPPSGTLYNGLIGDKVFARIFNSDNIATATKYIQTNDFYTVTSTAVQMVDIQTMLGGWSAWMNIGGVTPTDYTISGMFTTTNWDFADINIVATGIDAEDIVINGANYEITVPEGWSGTVTPTKAGYIMTPANREYTNVEADFENQNYAISKNVDPNAPVITYPAQGNVFEWEEAGEVTIEWEAGAGYVPEKYEIWFTGDIEWTDVALATEWTTPEIGEGEYTFKVRAVIDTPMGKSAVPVRARATDRSANNSVRGTGPEAQVDFEVVIETPPPVYTLTITSDPVGAAIYVGGVDTGEVAPFDFTVAGTYSVMMDGYTWAPEEYVWDGMADDAIEFVGTLIPADYDIDPETPAELDPQTVVEIAGPGFVGANIVTPGAYTPVPNPTFVATSEGILQLVGTGLVDITFTFDPPVAWFVYLQGGNWIAIEGPLATYVVTVNLDGKDATLEFKAGSGGDPTLPVELSVFNAVLTAQNFVKLSWVSESETNMLGYRVYRAESADQASAILITPIMIEATNTSTTQSYSIEDREVYAGATYYYWLEAVDYAHSSFFGYRAVEVLADITPELPVQSAMRNAYPNPFRANSNTNIEVSVKAGETGTVTIYNVLGQVVKTYSVSEGSHNLSWNGRDSKGNICGSGIYFYKMSTPSMNQTKKMVIVK